MKYCKRQVYAIETGDYVGKMFAVVDPKKEAIGCLILPQMENIDVPIESFDNGRNNDIIKLVEKLPKKVYSVVEAQYKKNEDPDNRRQQLNTPNISYSESSVEKDEESLGLPGK
jgi:hypothetical protein|tara:strand:+ start:11533 stop:11874 length:342 start_codon:yes stop_codon:yes gene_type:complete